MEYSSLMNPLLSAAANLVARPSLQYMFRLHAKVKLVTLTVPPSPVAREELPRDE